MSKRTQQLSELFSCDLCEVVAQGDLPTIEHILQMSFGPHDATEDINMTFSQVADHLLTMAIHVDQGMVAQCVLDRSHGELRFERSISLAAQAGAEHVLAVMIQAASLLQNQSGRLHSYKVHLGLGVESAAEYGRQNCLEQLLAAGGDPYPDDKDNHALMFAVRNGHTPIVQRLMQFPQFAHMHEEMLELAATRASTSNDMIDLLFDVSLAKQLMANPDLHFSRQTTNVYFLELYEAAMQQHAISQAVDETTHQAQDKSEHKRKM